MERLIKNVAFDTVTIITVWGLLNISNKTVNHDKIFNSHDKIFNSIITTTNIIGFGLSAYILTKYM